MRIETILHVMLYLAVAALLGYGMRETWPQADLPCILQKGGER